MMSQYASSPAVSVVTTVRDQLFWLLLIRNSGRQAPGGLRPDETPQFVVLTFDDAVNGKTFPDYKKLFENDVLKSVTITRTERILL